MRPEQVKVCVALDSGGVVVMSVVTNDGKNVNVEPTPDYIAKIIAQSSRHWKTGRPASWRFMTDAELPPTRLFRESWEDAGVRIVENMAKARVIHMNRIRAAREPVFAKLDRDYLRAHEVGDVVAMREIAGQKQVLRDLPQTFDLSGATTTAELAALWPQELPPSTIEVILTNGGQPR